MKKWTLTVFTLALIPFAIAHEGHNKTPGTLEAPHGGQVKGSSDHYFELVPGPQGFQLFPFDHDFKPVSLNSFEIDGTLHFPKQKKPQTLTLTPQGSHWESQVESKGYHRYTLKLKVKYQSKIENLQFTVETQN